MAGTDAEPVPTVRSGVSILRRTAPVLGGGRLPHQLLPVVDGLTVEQCRLLAAVKAGDLVLVTRTQKPHSVEEQLDGHSGRVDSTLISQNTAVQYSEETQRLGSDDAGQGAATRLAADFRWDVQDELTTTESALPSTDSGDGVAVSASTPNNSDSPLSTNVSASLHQVQSERREVDWLSRDAQDSGKATHIDHDQPDEPSEASMDKHPDDNATTAPATASTTDFAEAQGSESVGGAVGGEDASAALSDDPSPMGAQAVELDEYRFNRHGFDREGYDEDGFNRDGLDRDGYDGNGFDASGIDRDGYDYDGFDGGGYDRWGFNRHGLDENGVHSSAYDDEHSEQSYADDDGQYGPEEQDDQLLPEVDLFAIVGVQENEYGTVVDIYLQRLHYREQISQADGKTYRLLGDRIECHGDAAFSINFELECLARIVSEFDANIIRHPTGSQVRDALYAANSFNHHCNSGFLYDCSQLHDILSNDMPALYNFQSLCPVCLGTDIVHEQLELRVRVDNNSLLDITEAIEHVTKRNAALTEVGFADYAFLNNGFDESEWGFNFGQEDEETPLGANIVREADGTVWQYSTEALSPEEVNKTTDQPTDTDALANLPRCMFAEVAGDVGDPKCVICLEQMDANTTVLTLPCSHFFEEPCLRQWLARQHMCPVCRFPLPVTEQDESNAADDEANTESGDTGAGHNDPEDNDGQRAIEDIAGQEENAVEDAAPAGDPESFDVSI